MSPLTPAQRSEAAAFAVTIRGQGYLLSQQAHDIIVALLAATESPWQDIATAPKDGTQVLCAWVERLSDGTRYVSPVFHVLAWFQNWHGLDYGAWVLDGDFAVHFAPDGLHETPPVEYGDPTHWCALPAPPEKGK